MAKLQCLVHRHDSAGRPKRAIVFLHGLGAGADDFADLPSLLSLSSEVTFFFPQAPDLPVTVNGGMWMPAWYDIRSMNFERETDQETVKNSIKLLTELLEEIISEGIPPEQIIVGGFSQGGAMALELGLNFPQRLAGVIVLSAYCLSLDSLKKGNYDKRKKIPILQCHGRLDQVVPFELGNNHREIFQENGFKLDWYEENSLGHHLSPGEVKAMKEWLFKLNWR